MHIYYRCVSNEMRKSKVDSTKEYKKEKFMIFFSTTSKRISCSFYGRIKENSLKIIICYLSKKHRAIKNFTVMLIPILGSYYLYLFLSYVIPNRNSFIYFFYDNENVEIKY